MDCHDDDRSGRGSSSVLGSVAVLDNSLEAASAGDAENDARSNKQENYQKDSVGIAPILSGDGGG
jgi:hypothetical protein